MTELVLISLLLLLALTLLPLFFVLKRSVKAKQSRSREAENIAVFKETQQTLLAQRQAGEISQQQYESVYAELARDLLESPSSASESKTTEEKTAPAAVSSQQDKIALPVLLCALLLIAVLSLALYWKLGAYQDLQIKQELSSMMELQGEQQMQAYQQAMQKIENRFAQHPDKAAYGFLLAQQAMAGQQYNKAADAYQTILETYPEDARLLALYAQAKYLANNRQQDDAVRDALSKALTIEPVNTTALGLKGMIAFEEKDFQQALSTWQLLLQQLPADSQQAEIISQGIATAKKELGIVEQTATRNADTLLTLELSLDSALQLPAETKVFVAVRDKNRGMPVAAKRLAVADLPLTIDFSDNDSLMPQRLLSSMQQLEIVARASLSGQPMAQKGDYQSEVISFELGKQAEFQLTISELVE